MLVELGFEALEQRECIGSAAGESGENAILVQPAHLARAGLDDDVPERHLTVAAERDFAAAPDRKDGSAVKLR